MVAARAAAKGDLAGYLAATTGEAGGSVVGALLHGDPGAAETAAGASAKPDAAVGRGLLLLATPPADAAKLAAAKAAFLDALAAGDREDRALKRALEAAGADGLATVREAVIPPKDKRVYAAAAAVWFPAEKAELLALAYQLDYQRDVVSLALRTLTGGEPVKPAGGKPARPGRK